MKNNIPKGEKGIKTVRREPSERAVRIHQQLKAGRYPGCARLARELEVSIKTVRRDLQWLKDRYDLPIAYDIRRNGYYYTRPNVELPALNNLSRHEAYALLLAQLSLAQYPGVPFAEPAHNALEKLSWRVGDHAQLRLDSLEGALSFDPLAPEIIDRDVFELVTQGLRQRRALRCSYLKPGAASPTERTFHPYHVRCHDNAWYVIGFDVGRKALRTFALGRISDPQLLSERFPSPSHFDPATYFSGSLGVMRGEGDYEVILEFDAWATDLIKHRRWHPSQHIQILEGGSRVTLRLNNLEEIQRCVLSWGEHVTVIRPDLLRTRLLEVARLLTERYGTPERPGVTGPMLSLPDTPRFGVS